MINMKTSIGIKSTGHLSQGQRSTRDVRIGFQEQREGMTESQDESEQKLEYRTTASGVCITKAYFAPGC